jgi:hypothetical protein
VDYSDNRQASVKIGNRMQWLMQIN